MKLYLHDCDSSHVPVMPSGLIGASDAMDIISSSLLSQTPHPNTGSVQGTGHLPTAPPCPRHPGASWVGPGAPGPAGGCRGFTCLLRREASESGEGGKLGFRDWGKGQDRRQERKSAACLPGWPLAVGPQAGRGGEPGNAPQAGEAAPEP